MIPTNRVYGDTDKRIRIGKSDPGNATFELFPNSVFMNPPTHAALNTTESNFMQLADTMSQLPGMTLHLLLDLTLI